MMRIVSSSLFDISVNHNKQDRTDQADREPALLSVFVPVRDAEMKRIIKYTRRKLEIQAVLGLVNPVLGIVPDEPHRVTAQLHILYIQICQTAHRHQG
jgi:hypothetical protein